MRTLGGRDSLNGLHGNVKKKKDCKSEPEDVHFGLIPQSAPLLNHEATKRSRAGPMGPDFSINCPNAPKQCKSGLASSKQPSLNPPAGLGSAWMPFLDDP